MPPVHRSVVYEWLRHDQHALVSFVPMRRLF
jgi:hypothetical protein